MKKFVVLLTLLMGLVFPWACSDNHAPSTPSGTSAGIAATSTPTGTQTPGTPTYTPTQPVGAPTFTPTATFALTPAAYVNNYSTSAAPRGMVLTGGLLTVAESELGTGGIVTEMESYTGGGTGILNLYTCGGGPCIGNVILAGTAPIQTPGATPIAFSPTTITLNEVQGFVNPGGNAPGAWSAVLDLNGSGATLYTGYYSSWNSTTPPLGPNYMPYLGPSYGGIPFKNPQAICDDGTGGSGNVYVADTGNGTVDELSPYEGTPGDEPLPVHRFTGTAGVLVGGTGVVFSTASVTFKAPYAVACDTAVPPNVWVGDQGYFSTTGTSNIMEFTSGATTILESWRAIPGCKVSGMAIDPTTNNVFVADSGNNLVEIYSQTGTLISEIQDPGPAAHELYPFAPTCIAFSSGYIYVGDSGNDFIDIFH